MPAKLLVLAIDAASPALLEKWAADGTLPNLRSLMSRGLVGGTSNLDGFFIGSTWPSWYTGVTPARHGLHYLVQQRPGTYELYRPSEEVRLVQWDPFWTHLSRAGRRVAVLDVPVSAIERSLHGVQTVEWGGHDILFGTESHPVDLAKKIVAQFGEHPLRTSCDAIGRTARDYRAFIDRLVAGVRAKTAWTIDLLEQGDWDLFIQVFTETHCVGHQCWHLHDAEHPAHDPSTAAQTGDPLCAVYRAIDTAIGRVLERAGDARVLVLSLHGMSHAFGAQFMLRDLLFSLGAAHPLRTAPSANGIFRAGLRAAWRRLPSSLREHAAPLRHRLFRRAAAPELPRLGVDVAQSRCFPQANGLAVAGIRLNVAGREPSGILAPREVDAFSSELERDLLDIVDERSGLPLVRRVLETRDHYRGEQLDLLPDLLVEWDDRTPIGSTPVGGGAGATIRASSPKIGSVTGTNEYGRTGEHRPEGLFVAAGPGTMPSRLSGSVSILDFAPTIATWFDVPLPYSDGCVIPELLARWRGDRA